MNRLVKILDMKKQILLVLMVVCWSSVMAVRMPSNPYTPYSGGTSVQESYSFSEGVTIMNQSTVGAYNNDVCGAESGFGASDVAKCPFCCTENVYDPCIMEKGEGAWETCESLQLQCVSNCEDYALNEYRNPLDAPTAFLLALVAAYGAVAVYRRRMQQA